MTKTFLGLLPLADLSAKYSQTASMSSAVAPEKTHEDKAPTKSFTGSMGSVMSGLHYNIQIHLPATKDVEVYNAIFKALREHVFNE
jgi:acetoin utilization deacetylase AcuC-like enzyme